jgi:hypothetical protein
MNPIVFLGDPHLSDRQIQSRVDNTTETCLAKFEWVLNYASSIGADIICTGDVFTHTLYSNKTRFRLKMMLKDFHSKGLWFVSCAGNHPGDIEGTDVSTVPFREFGQFCLDGYMNLLSKDAPYWFKHGAGAIVGYSAYHDFPVVSGERCNTVSGMVCHHWIQDAFGDSLVVYPDDVKKEFPNLKFIVAGHDHAYHDPYYSRDGVLVVRPGSMMRTDAGKSSRRIPCVAVWRPDSDWWDYVPISCSRPYEEVFYSERRDIDASSANAVDRFVRQMERNVSVVLDVDSVVRSQYELVPAEDKGFIKADLVSSGFII